MVTVDTGFAMVVDVNPVAGNQLNMYGGTPEAVGLPPSVTGTDGNTVVSFPALIVVPDVTRSVAVPVHPSPSVTVSV